MSPTLRLYVVRAYLGTLAEVKKIATDAGIITSPVDETKLLDTSWIQAVVP